MKTKPAFALTRKQLYQRVWSVPLSTLARQMGLSGNALAKICNRLLVPYPTRGYWNKISAGKRTARTPLPAAPELRSHRVTISAVPAASRRVRTRLNPAVRRDQLLEIAADIIRIDGVHAATMKRIASTAGISETLAYNYFRSREKLFIELAQSESDKIQAARTADMQKAQGHRPKILAGTRTYLRQIDQRGGLLQMLMSNPDVRAVIRERQRKRNSVTTASHATGLVERYGISKAMAVGCTVVLSRLCMRAGKLIADKKITLESAERLCLSMILQGSRAITGGSDTLVG